MSALHWPQGVHTPWLRRQRQAAHHLLRCVVNPKSRSEWKQARDALNSWHQLEPVRLYSLSLTNRYALVRFSNLRVDPLPGLPLHRRGHPARYHLRAGARRDAGHNLTLLTPHPHPFPRFAKYAGKKEEKILNRSPAETLTPGESAHSRGGSMEGVAGGGGAGPHEEAPAAAGQAQGHYPHL